MQEFIVREISISDLPQVLPLSDEVKPPINTLYIQGNLRVLSAPRVTIVGTRKPTRYGREMAYDIAYKLARAGVTIISGLAFGIDSIAHQAALDAGGATVAVLPGPVTSIYPRHNASLARRIADQSGLLISEYRDDNLDDRLQKYHFIHRNRIMAALANVLLVIEAPHQSGTLHTATFGQTYLRTVAAIPGQINNPQADGSNQLIRDGCHIITDVDDIFGLLGIHPTKNTIHKLTDIQRTVLAHITEHRDQSTQALLSMLTAAQPTLTNALLLQTLSELEIKGMLMHKRSAWNLGNELQTIDVTAYRTNNASRIIQLRE